MSESRYADVVAWVQALPKDCEVAWGDECTDAALGCAYGCVDAYVPLLVEEVQLQWVWTITPTDSERFDEEQMHAEAGGEELAGPMEVRLSPAAARALGLDTTVELTIEEVAAGLGLDLDEIELKVEVETADGWEEIGRGRDSEPLDLIVPYDAWLEVVFQDGQALGAQLNCDNGEVFELDVQAIDSEGLSRGHARELNRWGEVSVRGRRVWRLETLDQALSDWASQHAARGDVRFVCREKVSPSPLSRRLARD
jgi:hypothetical protein